MSESQTEMLKGTVVETAVDIRDFIFAHVCSVSDVT